MGMVVDIGGVIEKTEEACRPKRTSLLVINDNLPSRTPQSQGSGEQVHGTSAADFARDLAVHLGRNTSHTAGKNLAGLRSELGKEFRVAHVHSASGDVDAATGHGLVAGAETDTAFDALEFGHHNRIEVRWEV